MNRNCAHCTTEMSHQRRRSHVLCESCERTWWVEYESVYREKLKSFYGTPEQVLSNGKTS